MRFKTRGTFETEALIDITQRIVAQLQDVGVPQISGVNIYLQTIDDTGTQRALGINGHYVDELDVCCDDLVCEEVKTEPELDFLEQDNHAVSVANHKYKRFVGKR